MSTPEDGGETTQENQCFFEHSSGRSSFSRRPKNTENIRLLQSGAALDFDKHETYNQHPFRHGI